MRWALLIPLCFGICFEWQELVFDILAEKKKITEGDVLHVTLLDADIGKDDVLGTTTVDYWGLEKNAEHEVWLDLAPPRTAQLDTLWLEVADKSTKEDLGHASVDLKALPVNETTDVKLPLVGVPSGVIHAEITYKVPAGGCRLGSIWGAPFLSWMAPSLHAWHPPCMHGTLLACRAPSLHAWHPSCVQGTLLACMAPLLSWMAPFLRKPLP